MPTELIYAFHDLQNRRDETVAEVGVDLIREKVLQWREMWSTATRAWVEDVAIRNPAWNTTPISRYEMPYPVSMELVDEHGIAEPVGMRRFYQVGLPLYRGEIAESWSWERMLTRTVQELSDALWKVQEADLRFIKERAMVALFFNTPYTFYSTEDDANMPLEIPVMPLAYGATDPREYLLKNGTFVQGADHYNAVLASITNTDDPFFGIYDRLARYATASRNIVAYIPTNLVASVRALLSVQVVQNTRFTIPSPQSAQLSDQIQSVLYFGDNVIGEHESGLVLVEWSQLPDNYIVTMDMESKPLGLRETPETARHGILTNYTIQNYGNADYERFRRILGFGVVNGISADITLIGSSTYTTPSGMRRTT